MRYLLLLLISITMVGCGGKDCPDKPAPATPSNPVQPTASGLSFSSVPGQAAALRSISAKAESASDFELGNVRNTTTYLFMLRNTGTVPVTDIQLTATNPSVEVVPNTIGILSPDGSGGLAPIIQVTVKHGSGAGHFGTAPLLTQGDLTFSISASGQDAANTVLASASLHGFVQVANFTIKKPNYYGFAVADQSVTPDLLMDLRTPTDSGAYFTTGYDRSTPIFDDSYATTDTVDPALGLGRTITNTGNCDLIINVDDVVTVIDQNVVTTRATVTVAPGESYTFRCGMMSDRGNPGNYGYYFSAVNIWSQSVVFDTSLPAVTSDSFKLAFREIVIKTQGG